MEIYETEMLVEKFDIVCVYKSKPEKLWCSAYEICLGELVRSETTGKRDKECTPLRMLQLTPVWVILI